MTRATATSAAIAAAMLAAAAVPAFAQRLGAPNFQSGPGAYGESHRNPSSGYVGASDKYGYPVAPGRGACIKLCPNDDNPCDPIQYKTADKRCSERF